MYLGGVGLFSIVGDMEAVQGADGLAHWTR